MSKKMNVSIYMDNLSPGELAQLMHLVNKSKVTPDSFDIQPGNVYYKIASTGEVVMCVCHSAEPVPESTRDFGNACKDKEYMKQRAFDIGLQNQIANFAKKVNGNWEPDWDDTHQRKWFVLYDRSSDVYGSDYVYCRGDVGMISFESEDLVIRCINEVVRPYVQRRNM